MSRPVLLLFLGLAAALAGFGLLADRALVREAAASAELSSARSEQDARAAALSVRGTLGQIEQDLLAGRNPAGVRQQTLAFAALAFGLERSSVPRAPPRGADLPAPVHGRDAVGSARGRRGRDRARRTRVAARRGGAAPGRSASRASRGPPAPGECPGRRRRPARGRSPEQVAERSRRERPSGGARVPANPDGSGRRRGLDAARPGVPSLRGAGAGPVRELGRGGTGQPRPEFQFPSRRPLRSPP